MGVFDGVLLASDIDGTLLNHRHEMTAPVKSALESFVARGGLFTVATGRSLAGTAVLRPLLPLTAPAVLSNGAYIYDYQAGRELHAEWLAGPFEEALADIRARFPGLGTELHRPDRVWILDYNRWNEVHMNAVRCVCEKIGDLRQAPAPWLKILLVDEPETLQAVAAYAVPKWGETFSFLFSAPCLLEMQNAGVDKAAGVQTLARMLRVERQNIYTVGDAGNDLGMLRAFESFAPASATAEARAAATRIVPGCDQDALAAVVRFLEERYG
ncbi:MAG: HAD-IIB family hydrolase [Oscillospiraceae bacterium]|nr:HAD-IIB family hydrolase [Oscillospiraceae bacterium]